jgi:hypothetical protein
MKNSTSTNKNTQDYIDEFGLTIMHVLGDDEGSQFSYSIGLFKTYEHPEIIIIGLKQNLAHTLINNMAHDIKGGKVFTPLKYDADIIDGFRCYFIEVEKSNYNNYVGQATQYYNGDGFPLLQCIYPTVKGIYPWEDEWPESIKDLQPILWPLK